MGKKIKAFLINRLDERSTWRAIVALLTLAGLGLGPSQSEAIITAGIAIGAALEALLPDPAGRIRKPVAPELPAPPVSSDPIPGAESIRAGAPIPKDPAERSRQDWLGG